MTSGWTSTPTMTGWLKSLTAGGRVYPNPIAFSVRETSASNA